MSKRFLAVLSVGLLFIGILVPLSVSNAQYAGAPSVSTSTRFRVVVAAPLSTSVDVYLDGTITTESGLLAVKPLNVSGFVTTVAGSHTITLDQTGTTTQVGTPFVTSFVAGTNYTIILLSDMTWMVMTDNNVAPAAGQFNARVVNLSVNNNPVSVSYDGTVPSAWNAVAYKAGSGYFTGNIGLHALAIPGSTAKTINYNFQDGHVYSIFIFWDPNKTTPVIIPKSDTTFIKSTPTGGTPVVTVTPGPTPTVGVAGPARLWIPVVENNHRM